MIHITASTEEFIPIVNPEEQVTIEATSSMHVYLRVPEQSATNALTISGTVEANAEVHIVVLQQASSMPIDIHQVTTTKNNATVHICIATLGSAESTHEVHTTLEGDSSTSNVQWLFFGKQNEQHSMYALNEFRGRHGAGEMLLKGVAQDTATVTCNGMIAIGPKGNETDTYLTEDVLMLDPTATVHATPGLEIKTNDVKASHSATVSRVTAEDLFYFAARGIDEAEARTMFIEGYLGSIVELMPEAVQEQMMAEIVHKYEKIQNSEFKIQN